MKNLREMFEHMGFDKVQNQISQMRRIYVREEISNWLQVALQDRLQRDLTFDEREIVNLFAQKLQSHYEELLDAVQARSISHE